MAPSCYTIAISSCRITMPRHRCAARIVHRRGPYVTCCLATLSLHGQRCPLLALRNTLPHYAAVAPAQPFPPMSRLGMPQARTRQRPCCHLPSYHRTLGRSLKRRGGRGRKEGVGDNHGFAWEGTIFSFIPYESFVRVCFKELNI